MSGVEEEYDGLPQREGIVELVYDECQEPIAPGSYRVSVYLITLPPLPPIRFTERDDKGHLSYHSYFVKPEGRIGQILVRRLNDKDIWNKEYSLLRGENGGLVRHHIQSVRGGCARCIIQSGDASGRLTGEMSFSLQPGAIVWISRQPIYDHGAGRHHECPEPDAIVEVVD